MTYHLKEPLPMAPIYLPPPPANTIDRPLDHPNHIDEKIDLDTEPYGDTSPAARPSSAVSRKKAFVPISVYNERAKSPVYRLSGPTDSTLLFESHFESGNLSKATKIEEFTYELTVRRDYETAGHTQWFYFRIDNVVSGIDYTFKICNLMKPKSLYGDGMRPLLYSNHLASLEGLGWTRAGFRISYSVNPEKDELTKMPLHTLTFSMRFPQTRDTVYIAHCYPYTYTHLQNYIQLLKRNPLLENIFRHKVLGKTPGGNNLDMLCISTKVESPAELAKRRAVVLIGRVHPGETNSSFFMHGFIEFITGDSKEAQFLRDHYVVKLIPMLNPDGVIVGNYRCNLKGFDLNRQWKMPPGHEANAPEVHMVKAMIERTLAAREIAFFCDMHGHSRKHGVFLYGCNNKDSPVHENKERIFPYLLSRRNPHFFVFERCHYRLQAKKQGTARIVMRNEFRIINSFTVETSFCGSDSLQVHFNQRHLRSMGADFALTLHAYLHQYPSIETTAIDWNAICSQPGTGTSAIADELFVSSESDTGDDDTTSDEETLRAIVKSKKKKKCSKRATSAKTTEKRPTASSPALKTPLDRRVSLSRASSRPNTPRPSTPTVSAAAARAVSPVPVSSGKDSKVAQTPASALSASKDPVAQLKIHNFTPSIIRATSAPKLRREEVPKVPFARWYSANSVVPLHLASSRPGSASRVQSSVFDRIWSVQNGNHGGSVTEIPRVTLVESKTSSVHVSFPSGIDGSAKRCQRHGAVE